METVNYGRNKFYDTNPRSNIHKISYKIIVTIIVISVPHLKCNRAILNDIFVFNAMP